MATLVQARRELNRRAKHNQDTKAQERAKKEGTFYMGTTDLRTITGGALAERAVKVQAKVEQAKATPEPKTLTVKQVCAQHATSTGASKGTKPWWVAYKQATAWFRAIEAKKVADAAKATK